MVGWRFRWNSGDSARCLGRKNQYLTTAASLNRILRVQRHLLAAYLSSWRSALPSVAGLKVKVHPVLPFLRTSCILSL